MRLVVKLGIEEADVHTVVERNRRGFCVLDRSSSIRGGYGTAMAIAHARQHPAAAAVAT